MAQRSSIRKFLQRAAQFGCVGKLRIHSRVRSSRAKRRTPDPFGSGLSGKAPGDDLLLHGLSHTTIGAAAFHFRVRDGIGWFHSAMVARERGEGRRRPSGKGTGPRRPLISWEVANGWSVSIDVTSRVRRLEVI